MGTDDGCRAHVAVPPAILVPRVELALLLVPLLLQAATTRADAVARQTIAATWRSGRWRRHG